MRRRASLVLLVGLLGAAQAATPGLTPDPPKTCDACGPWNEPQEPFRVFGNTYFVGTQGLAAILIVSTDGHILLDGGLTQSAPLIAANIRKLNFKVEDIRLIVNSHMHYDHAGGIAALQRASGARVAASAASAVALEQGGLAEDDPQYAFGPEHNDFPRVANVRVVRDDETLRVGKLSITARFTPGHTPGGTTWTWRSCEAKQCLDMVYADSLNSVSAPGFRFSSARDQSRVDTFRRSIARVAALPCDVLLAPHPQLIDMAAKLERRAAQPDVNPFIDRQACTAYAGAAGQRLDQRIAEEGASSN